MKRHTTNGSERRWLTCIGIFMLINLSLVCVGVLGYSYAQLHGFGLFSDLSWEADVWAGSRSRFYFDECDFNAVTVLKSFTFEQTAKTAHKEGDGMEGKGIALSKTGFAFGGESRDIDATDLWVTVSVILDKEWKHLEKPWSDPNSAWRRGKKPFFNLRKTCNDPQCSGSEGLNPAVKRVFEVSSATWMSSVPLKEALDGVPKWTSIWNPKRAYTLTMLLWLERRNSVQPMHCAHAAPDRPRGFWTDALTIQATRKGGIVSLEFTWDAFICAILLAVWIACRCLDSGKNVLGPAACDLYASAYLFSLIALAGSHCYGPPPFLQVLRFVAKVCSVGADLALILGFLASTWGGSEAEKSMFRLGVALLLAALIPAWHTQVGPGFFMCADGSDPLHAPVPSSILLRMLPVSAALPFIVDSTWSHNGMSLAFSALAFAAAPALSALVTLILTSYAQRKVQLLLALSLRTVGAVFLLTHEGGEEDMYLPKKNEDAKRDATHLRVERSPSIKVALLSACVVFITSVVFVNRLGAKPSVDFIESKGKWKLVDSASQPYQQLEQEALEKQNREAKARQEEAQRAAASAQRAPGVPGMPAGPSDVIEPAGKKDTCFKAETQAEVKCTDPHSDPESKDQLHIVFASNQKQMQGVQASISSIITASRSPEDLTFHLLVQEKKVAKFAVAFGFPEKCLALMTPRGARLLMVPVGKHQLEASLAKVSDSVRNERGSIDTVENFARFYMHTLLTGVEFAIYLDADTIVQEDLSNLKVRLQTSGKTVGFVSRDKSIDAVKMKSFLKDPKNCGNNATAWSEELLSRDAYNVGVYVVNLKRWRDLKITERVEEYVRRHNACGGNLWVGGSQPPMLLAFLDYPKGDEKDYIVFDPTWNTGDLGWRESLSLEVLVSKFVLHWNGKRKPWMENGLYSHLWTAHCERFGDFLRTPLHEFVAGTSEKEEAAQRQCPKVQLLDEWTKNKSRCTIGETFGCVDTNGEISSRWMWASNGCEGLFSMSGVATWCGRPPHVPDEDDICHQICPVAQAPVTTVAPVTQVYCEKGQMPKAAANCGIMILTTFFTTKMDWQRQKFVKPSYKKIQLFYSTAMRRGLNVTVIYDQLPYTITHRYGHSRFRFEQIHFRDFDRRLGINDVRYFFFHRLLRRHPEWRYIFLADAFDVRVAGNPCHGVQEGTLYIGGEKEKLQGHPWMRGRFEKMGGKYLNWYNQIPEKHQILNCGLMGGSRTEMLNLFQHMMQVMLDPTTPAFRNNETINLNMAALNYIMYNRYKTFVTGMPFHSRYKLYEDERRDVWFVHK